MKALRGAALVVLLVYLSLAALELAKIDYTNCEKYSKQLNGRERMYAGNKYRAVLCGRGPDQNLMNDHVRLQIFSQEGELLAERKFVVDWDTNKSRLLEYHDNHITYYDASKEYDFEKTVSMPPTRFDWMRARIPLAD